MKVKALLTDDDAVSPVIGVILMVAITVILAAVIGTFVLGLQNRVGEAAPNAAFTWEFNDQGDGWGSGNDYVNITHDGGEQLTASNIEIQVGEHGPYGTAGKWGGSSGSITAGSTVVVADSSTYGAGAPGGPGVNVTSGGSPTEFEEGDTIRVIWNNPEGDKTQTIGQNEVS